MSRPEKLRKAAASVVEALEDRRMMTTVVGGGVDSAGNVYTRQYEYVDATGNIAVVTVGGRTVAELIFARVTQTNNTVLSDLVPPPPPNITAEGRDLFHVYVAQSDARSFITISQRQTQQPFNLTPFNDGAGSFRISRNDNGQSATIDAGGNTGALLLGAKTIAIQGVQNSEDRPILSRAIPGAYGVRPALGARVTAGFQVAEGMDFGKFFFGGTVLGLVNVPGSMDTFYAGNLWTGDARGTTLGGGIFATRRSPNFIVGGNLHSLLVSGGVGSDDSGGGPNIANPDYLTGFDMQIGGQLGHASGALAWMGGANVLNAGVKDEFGAVIEEIEGISAFTSPNAPANGWRSGLLEGNNIVRNDTFDTPQYLPSFAGRRGRSEVVVDGQITAAPRITDYSDYYGLPLLAGQSVEVNLQQALGTGIGGTGVAFLSVLSVGVFDPDGRLVETDYFNTAAGLRASLSSIQSLRFTADRPGTYRIAVAVAGDADYNGTGGEFNTSNVGNAPYRLTINGGGNLALGGIASDGVLFDAQGSFGTYGYFVQNGDMGALQSDSDIISVLTMQSAVVRKGSLRSIEGAQVGSVIDNLLGVGPALSVPRGNVGLVRSTTGVLVLNDYGTAASGSGIGGGVGGVPLVFGEAIGGDYQVVDAATTFLGDILANRSIGTVRAGDMQTRNYASAFYANVDAIGDDGIIDLIDVTGDLGTIQAGGPAISTGPGGNLRYISVGGTTYRDRFFGGGQGEETTFNPGQTVTFTDDSGAAIEIAPFPLVRDPLFVPGGTGTLLTGPTLTILTYPVRGSGGQAVVRVDSTGSVRVGGGGGGGTRAHVEIGTIRTLSTLGNPVIRDQNGDLVFSLPTTGTGAVNLDVLIDGSGTVDVYRIQGNNLTSIRNRTPGEIVNISSALPGTSTIGSLEGYSIGVPKHHTGAFVGGKTVLSDVFPFRQQRNLITANNILNIEASGPVGNISAQSLALNDGLGNIGNVTADAGGRNVRGDFEGIAGPIVAAGAATNAATILSGNIGNVDIGEGILPSGTGNISRAGIYASGRIGAITNEGASSPSDIRGNIVGSSGIDSISLSNGSIIAANIFAVTDFAQSRRISNVLTLPSGSGSLTNPQFQIGDISLGGSGGIIGSHIAAGNIGRITVARGFGIFTSRIVTAPAGRIQAITAEGYGVRDSIIGLGATVDSISAPAKGRNVSVLEYSPSVRQSEVGTFDPFTGQGLSVESDLHYALGTSGRKPQLAGITDTGVIEALDARGSRDLNSVFAHQIRSNPTGTPTSLSFGNTIGRIRTRSDIAGLSVTAGRLKSFLAGGNVALLNATMAGPIESFRVNQTMDASSAVRAQGPSGNVLEFIIDGDLNGDLFSSRTISLLAVGGDIGPSSLVQAQEIKTQQVRGGVLGTIQEG
jgi:hypothetical protein